MTLIKSILLGSAAGIVAVASAQAADLPTKKAAPVAEYVKICNVGGITGWTLPGSDTCVKLSGYITGQFVAGNLNNQYNWGSYAALSNGLVATNPALAAQLGLLAVRDGATGGLGNLSGGHSTQRVLIQGSDGQNNSTFYRDATGFTVRANLALDFASNTAYGPLIGHFDVNHDSSSGLDNTGTTTVLNTGYLTWAGITAGMAPSFFSFTGGGDNWANFLSPDRKGFNQPQLFAYTASFGGGFSATLSFENPKANSRGGGSNSTGSAGYVSGSNPGNITFGGLRWPDIVGALHVKQGWGEAQISGVLHNVNVNETNLVPGQLSCGIGDIAVPCNSRETKTGWALDAGVSFNLPSIGPGDIFLLTGEYGQSASGYSGLTYEAMWGEVGQVNGNGQPMYLADAFFNPLTNQWSSPTTWSVSALFEHHFTPQFYVDLEGSFGGYNWSNQGGGCNIALPSCILGQGIQGALSPHGTTWIIGADLGWVPVTNLNFDLELMYQAVNQAKPSGAIGTIYNLGNAGGATFVPGAWEGNSSGFAGRVRITRYF